MDKSGANNNRNFSLSRSLSRKVKTTTKKALPDEKLSLNDDFEVKADEHSWNVRMKSSNATKKVERILVAGPTGLRLLIPDTLEEVGKFPYKRMKEFSHNESFKLFQFTWFPSDKEEETFFFNTSKCKDIQVVIGKFIKDILRQQNVENPDAILQQCTYQRPPQIDRIREGGRQRSYSSEGRVQKKPKGAMSVSVKAGAGGKSTPKPRTKLATTPEGKERPHKKPQKKEKEKVAENDFSKSSSSESSS